VAIGTAWVQRFTPDSLKAFLPEAEPDVARLIEHDWMRGDTVRAFFTAATVDTAGDTAGVNAETNAERVIERITATGGPAQAMHKSRPDDAADDTRLSIAYLVGNVVAITFANGLVSEVQASDDVRGVYLQPRDAARATNAQRSPRRSPGQ
jgi:cytochrome P450